MKKIISLLFVSVVFTFLCARPSFALLEGFNSGCLADPNWTPSHVATLTIQKGAAVPTIDTKTWIFVCITKDTQTYCTTGGTGANDTELFGSTEHYNILKGLANDVGGVKTGSNPSKTNNDAANPQFNETITWGDAYPQGVIHQWSWVQAAAPVGGVGAGGEIGAQQQADLIFERISDDTKKCAKIGWDPRGVVFDINTMYPVKGAVVELYKKNAASTYDLVPNQLGIVNPYTTNTTNGQFNFFVDEGWYKLKLKGGNVAPLTTTQKITANGMFIDESGEDHVYSEDTAIFEKKGTVAIANIPVSVTDETSLIKELKILDNVSPTLEGDSIRLFGRVSHPKSKMIVTMSMLNEKGETKQFVKVDYTDGLGEYDKLISQTVDSDETLVFQGATLSFELNSFYTTGTLSKKNSTGNSITRFIKGVWDSVLSRLEANAVTSATTIQIKPMPSYIEGIAYDAKGAAIPKAIIGIYPFFSEKPYYLTIADENGRYKIGAQHIPQFEYSLRYKKPTGEVLVLDTSTFVKQNAKLMIDENIKPYVAKKTTVSQEKKVETYFASINTPVELKSPEEKQRAAIESKKTQTAQTTGRNANTTSGQSSRDIASTANAPQTPSGTLGGAGMQGIIMVVVALLILVMVGVGAFIMMKSKQQSTPQY